MYLYKKGEKAKFTKTCEICGEKIEDQFTLCGRCQNLVNNMKIECNDIGLIADIWEDEEDGNL
jgi:hypothetical protein